MTDPGSFGREVLARFPGSHTTPDGEVWVAYEDAIAAVELAQERGLRLLGMDGLVVGESNTYPSLSRIADYSNVAEPGLAYAQALASLHGPWSSIPGDLHSEAEGRYVIDLVVDD